MKVEMRDNNFKAPHLEGGNYFDDMRIDISEAHRRFADLPRNPKSIKQSKCRNLINFWITKIAVRLGIQEFLIVNGIRRRWLHDFERYWRHILNGIAFHNNIDFFLILHDYIKRHQYTSQLEWGDPAKHIKNWQQPNQLYATMQMVRTFAMNPIVGPQLWRKLSKDMRILEFGCALSPFYYCYRNFFSHLGCKWILADLPGFPFHYAKFLYRNDAEVEFITIDEGTFLTPLEKEVDFDVIILTQTFQSLENPLYLAQYLLERLKPNGLFVYDYGKGRGGIGLEHPNALKMREVCLKYIWEKTQNISGKIGDVKKSIGLCISKKKPF